MQRFLLKLLFILYLFPTEIFATTYYIRPTGNDANSGTGSNPTTSWQTLNPINSNVFLPGDNILLEGSYTYSGHIYFDQQDAGTANAPITISSFGNGRATINSGNAFGFYGSNTAGIIIKNLNFTGSGIASNTNYGVFFYSDQATTQLDFIRIDSLTVSGYLKSGIGLGSDATTNKGYSNVRITNCIAHSNGEAGISSFGSDKTTAYAHQNFYIGFNTVYNNTGRQNITTGNTGNGIVISAVNSCTIEHCMAYNNGALNGQICGGPVGIWCYAANNVVIQYCEAYNNKAGKNCDGGGFDLDGGVTNSIMQYNYSHNNEGSGYLISQYEGAIASNNNTIRYNISENDGRKNGAGGIYLYSSGSNGGIQKTTIYNNTIYISPATTTPSGITVEGPILTTSFRNNIIQTTGNVPLITARATSGISYQGNCYWPSGSNFIINWGGTNYTNLNTWRTSTNQEKNGATNTGLQVNPALTSPGNGGTIGNTLLLNTLNAYELLSSSPLINTGLNLNSLFSINPGPKDFYGVTIPQNRLFDIGAGEYNDTICSASGNIFGELWTGVAGTAVSAIPVNTTPSSTSMVTSFEGPSNNGDNYGARYRGYLCVRNTGNYTFWIASDDYSELWLSTDENPSNKIKIASVAGYTTSRQWDKYSTQKSSPISLTTGRRYYIEALHKEATGQDNLAVGWQLPNGTMERPIPGNRLLPYGNASPLVSITSPTNGQNFNAPAIITINANASDSDGTITKVEFFNGTTKLGETTTLPYSYTWTNVSAGTYSITAKASDNKGAQTTSTPININVFNTTGCNSTGFIIRELWTGISGSSVSNIPVNVPPNSTSMVTNFRGPNNVADNYGARYRGFVCPPTTGNYTFWISSDDDSELWLSTDINPSNKIKIAYVVGTTSSLQFTKYPSQRSVLIPLIAGQSYYIEALHKESTGQDHVAVGWQLPGGALERPIPGNRLSSFTGLQDIINQLFLIRQETISTERTDSTSISVFPNPVQKGSMTISIEGYERTKHKAYIEIKDTQGLSVYKDKVPCDITCSRTLVPIDEKFKTGMYIINVTIDKKVFSERLLIE